ncbi:UNVERIFIED_CONTAM: hypothetical protein FKN15_008248 [Acipenser sinensis]
MCSSQFKCCGVSNSSDWNEILGISELPRSCCSGTGQPFCKTWDTPCYKQVKDWLHEHIHSVLVFGIAIGIVQVLLLLLLLLFVYLADAFIQGDLQRLGCVNYASAAESLTTTSHPKDGAQGGEVTCSGSHNESVAEVG